MSAPLLHGRRGGGGDGAADGIAAAAADVGVWLRAVDGDAMNAAARGAVVVVAVAAARAAHRCIYHKRSPLPRGCPVSMRRYIGSGTIFRIRRRIAPNQPGIQNENYQNVSITDLGVRGVTSTITQFFREKNFEKNGQKLSFLTVHNIFFFCSINSSFTVPNFHRLSLNLAISRFF